MEIRNIRNAPFHSSPTGGTPAGAKEEFLKNSQPIQLDFSVEGNMSQGIETDIQIKEKITSMLETWQMPASKEYVELASFLLDREWPLTMENVQLFHQAFFLMEKDIELAFFILENQLSLDANLPQDIKNLIQKENLLGDLLASLEEALVTLPPYLQQEIQGHMDLVKPIMLTENQMNNEPHSLMNRANNGDEIDFLLSDLSQKTLDYFISADINPLDIGESLSIAAEIKQIIIMAVKNILEVNIPANRGVEARPVGDMTSVSMADLDKLRADILQTIEKDIIILFNGRTQLATNHRVSSSFISSLESDIEKIIMLLVDINKVADKQEKAPFIPSKAGEFSQKPSGEDMKESVTNYFKQIKETTKKITNCIEQWQEKDTEETKEQLLSLVDKMDRKIERLDELRQLIYLQMPMKINHEVVDTEIYLFNQDKKQPKHMVSAVITMNFNYIGYVEAFIIRHKDKVYCEFRANSPAEVQMLGADLLQLQERLIGLSLVLEKAQVNLLESPFNLTKGNPFQGINQKKEFQRFQQDI